MSVQEQTAADPFENPTSEHPGDLLVCILIRVDCLDGQMDIERFFRLPFVPTIGMHFVETGVEIAESQSAFICVDGVYWGLQNGSAVVNASFIRPEIFDVLTREQAAQHFSEGGWRVRKESNDVE